MVGIRPAGADDDDHDVGHPVGHLDQAVGGVGASGRRPTRRARPAAASRSTQRRRSLRSVSSRSAPASEISTSQGAGPSKVLRPRGDGRQHRLGGWAAVDADQEAWAIDELASSTCGPTRSIGCDNRPRRPSVTLPSSRWPIALRARVRHEARGVRTAGDERGERGHDVVVVEHVHRPSVGRRPCRASSSTRSGTSGMCGDETLDELERDLGDAAPALPRGVVRGHRRVRGRRGRRSSVNSGGPPPS